MTWISEKQKSTMVLIDELVEEFGEERWFVQHELHGVTKHTMDALVEKGYLDCKLFATKSASPVGIMYYRRLKTLEEQL